jgi:hypothetical protein
VVAQLRDMGFLERFLYEKIPLVATVRWTPQSEQDVLEKITPQHIFMALFLILMGLFVGMLAFVVEHVKHFLVEGCFLIFET